MEFERIESEIFLRTKPSMGDHVPFSARRICWPPPQESWYRGTHPRVPVQDRPGLLPLQVWKKFNEIRVSYMNHIVFMCSHIIFINSLQVSQLNFYNTDAWGTERPYRVEMLNKFRQWGDSPHLVNCWTLPTWPEHFEVCNRIESMS